MKKPLLSAFWEAPNFIIRRNSSPHRNKLLSLNSTWPDQEFSLCFQLFWLLFSFGVQISREFGDQEIHKFLEFSWKRLTFLEQSKLKTTSLKKVYILCSYCSPNFYVSHKFQNILCKSWFPQSTCLPLWEIFFLQKIPKCYKTKKT